MLTIDATTAFLVVHGLSTVLCTGYLVWRIGRLERRPSQRETRLAKLEAEVDELYGRVRKVTGKLYREGHHKPADEPTAPEPVFDTQRKPTESDGAFKARMRQLLAAGKLQHHN
jgi:hypothetical protein